MESIEIRGSLHDIDDSFNGSDSSFIKFTVDNIKNGMTPIVECNKNITTVEMNRIINELVFDSDDEDDEDINEEQISEESVDANDESEDVNEEELEFL